MVFVSSVVNENVPTHVSASGGGGGLRRRGAPAEGSSAEVSLRQGVWGRGLAGRMGRRRGGVLRRKCKNKKNPNQKIARNNKMQKFTKSLNKGG